MTILSIKEQLDRIERLIENKSGDKWLNTNQVSIHTGLSNQTIYRAVKSGALKVSRRKGKLIFRLRDVEKWQFGS